MRIPSDGWYVGYVESRDYGKHGRKEEQKLIQCSDLNEAVCKYNELFVKLELRKTCAILADVTRAASQFGARTEAGREDDSKFMEGAVVRCFCWGNHHVAVILHKFFYNVSGKWHYNLIPCRAQDLFDPVVVEETAISEALFVPIQIGASSKKERHYDTGG